MCQYLGGSLARREAEFSKFKERGGERDVLFSLEGESLWNLEEGGSAVLLGGAPLALCQVPVLVAAQPVAELGPRYSTPGPEVYVKLRPLAGRHFNCGFQ